MGVGARPSWGQRLSELAPRDDGARAGEGSHAQPRRSPRRGSGRSSVSGWPPAGFARVPGATSFPGSGCGPLGQFPSDRQRRRKAQLEPGPGSRSGRPTTSSRWDVDAAVLARGPAAPRGPPLSDRGREASRGTREAHEGNRVPPHLWAWGEPGTELPSRPRNGEPESGADESNGSLRSVTPAGDPGGEETDGRGRQTRADAPGRGPQKSLGLGWGPWALTGVRGTEERGLRDRPGEKGAVQRTGSPEPGRPTRRARRVDGTTPRARGLGAASSRDGETSQSDRASQRAREGLWGTSEVSVGTTLDPSPRPETRNGKGRSHSQVTERAVEEAPKLKKHASPSARECAVPRAVIF